MSGPPSLARTGLIHEFPDARIVYDVRGEGPDVVLIHGWTCRRTDFDGVAADLARERSRSKVHALRT